MSVDFWNFRQFKGEFGIDFLSTSATIFLPEDLSCVLVRCDWASSVSFNSNPVLQATGTSLACRTDNQAGWIATQKPREQKRSLEGNKNEKITTKGPIAKVPIYKATDISMAFLYCAQVYCFLIPWKL